MRVVVLEDMEVRVEWLRAVLRSSNTEIVWCKDVATFMDAVKADHDLVIFDHDLELLSLAGYSAPSEPNGTDAARLYTGRGPALVWSANPDGAARITEILQKKGIPVTQIAFEASNLFKMAQGLREYFK